MAAEIRALRASDDRAPFKSGDEALDLFFHRFAGQNQFKHHVGVTYVAVEEGRVLGFATVAPGSMDVEDVPGGTKLPRYPAPILRLGRLAVAGEARGRGLGAALLRYVLALALRQRDELGCVGIVVDAKPGAVAFYGPYGFTPMRVVEGESLVRPAATMMFLPIGSVPDTGR